MVHLYFIVAPRLRSECRYASGRVRSVKPLLPLCVPLAGVALFAVQVRATDDGAGAEFCVGMGHGFSLPISAAAQVMARRVFSSRSSRDDSTTSKALSPTLAIVMIRPELHHTISIPSVIASRSASPSSVRGLQ